MFVYLIYSEYIFLVKSIYYIYNLCIFYGYFLHNAYNHVQGMYFSSIEHYLPELYICVLLNKRILGQ
jgi:hypothetical protein